MKSVPMTVLNQHPSEVTRLVESGETVQVTRHGRPVLRMVPEPTAADPLGPLIAAGLIRGPSRREPLPRRGAPLLSLDEAERAIARMKAEEE